MNNKTFASAINCMDGRTQIPVIKYLKKQYNIDYVDMITEPGPEKIISEFTDNNLINSIKDRLAISIEKHNSKLIAIVGHYDCAGNPVDKYIQIKQILASIKIIKSWYEKLQVIGLWFDENWKINAIKNTN